jgi:toxin ParE1/3/4
LAEAPKSAPACDHIRSGYRRRNVERHMIYFRITDYGIAIIRSGGDRPPGRPRRGEARGAE